MKTKINLELIKKQRENKNISLKEMANVLGFKNASTYLKYEVGSYAFKAEMLPVMSLKLEIPLSHFFEEDIAETEIKESV